MTGDQSHLLLTYVMVPSSTGVTIKIPKLRREVPALRQDQCINIWWIKTGFDFFGPLIIQLKIYEDYTRTIKLPSN